MNATPLPEDHEALAAEYAIGLLEGAALDHAEHLYRADATFTQRVDAWRARLHPLDMTARETVPDAALWNRIEARLAEPQPVKSRQGQSVPAPHRNVFDRLWSSLGFWRPAGLIAAMASLVLAVGLGLALRETARAPVLVAVLMTDANQPGAIVNVLADGRAELVPLGDIPVPAGRVLQIWTLWDQVRGPVSVGLANAARRLELDIKALPRTVPTQLFEITLEPQGGSPTGRPTGPILMKGNATTAL